MSTVNKLNFFQQLNKIIELKHGLKECDHEEYFIWENYLDNILIIKKNVCKNCYLILNEKYTGEHYMK